MESACENGTAVVICRMRASCVQSHCRIMMTCTLRACTHLHYMHIPHKRTCMHTASLPSLINTLFGRAAGQFDCIYLSQTLAPSLRAQLCIPCEPCLPNRLANHALWSVHAEVAMTVGIVKNSRSFQQVTVLTSYVSGLRICTKVAWHA